MTEPPESNDPNGRFTTDQLLALMGLLVAVATAALGGGFALRGYVSEESEPPPLADDHCVSEVGERGLLLRKNTVLDGVPGSIVVQLFSVAGEIAPEAALKIVDGNGERCTYGIKVTDVVEFTAVDGKKYHSRVVSMRETPVEQVCLSSFESVK